MVLALFSLTENDLGASLPSPNVNVNMKAKMIFTVPPDLFKAWKISTVDFHPIFVQQ